MASSIRTDRLPRTLAGKLHNSLPIFLLVGWISGILFCWFDVFFEALRAWVALDAQHVVSVPRLVVRWLYPEAFALLFERASNAGAFCDAAHFWASASLCFALYAQAQRRSQNSLDIVGDPQFLQLHPPLNDDSPNCRPPIPAITAPITVNSLAVFILPYHHTVLSLMNFHDSGNEFSPSTNKVAIRPYPNITIVNGCSLIKCQ